MLFVELKLAVGKAFHLKTGGVSCELPYREKAFSSPVQGWLPFGPNRMSCHVTSLYSGRVPCLRTERGGLMIRHIVEPRCLPHGGGRQDLLHKSTPLIERP